MDFCTLSDTTQGVFCVCMIGIFVLGLCNLFRSIQVKRRKYIFISIAILLIDYMALQVIGDSISHYPLEPSAWLSNRLVNINAIWWIIFLLILLGISITLASFFKHWKEEHITPMSVKDSIDLLHAGLCYWEEGGRIVLSNKRMDEICLAVTGEALLNGDSFYEAIQEDWMTLPDGSITSFVHNIVDFDDKKIHELVATDVTELYKKKEMLEQQTIVLQKMNENLRKYNQDIDEIIRKQEILDTKVYIHDEMNRLMLVTTAATEGTLPEEEFCSILTLWRNNAILLGTESDKTKVNADITEVNQLAELLGIQIKWQGEQPGIMPDYIREVFIMVAGETIANAVKHAEAKNITIRIHKKKGKLLIEISNDGKLPVGEITLGGGLSNIKRMVEEKKGQFRVEVNEHFNVILDFELADWRGKNQVDSNKMMSNMSKGE
ncbi:MAG: hypothetical protein J6L65_07075 [Lachnospiraceae bacterium]|nr:hypothetical protein [Lachnospiraceae bacterium]